MKQESHSSSSSSSSPSSPTVGEISVREREDAPNSDISPVPVSELVVDDRSEICKTDQNYKGPMHVRIWVSTVFILISLKTEIARSVKGPKLQGPHAEDAMAKPYLERKFW